MEPVESQSDDPVLRHAVRRALGSETAPPALRGRIEAMLATELRKEQTKAKVFWRRPAFSMVAAAAVLLIGLGIAYQIVNRETEAPKFFADAMVVTHDNCTALSDHHLLSGVSNNANVDELRKKLREQLPHPVLVAMLGEGWQFQGAGVCQISGVPTSHLLF